MEQVTSPPSSKGCSSGGHFLFPPLPVFSLSYCPYSDKYFLVWVLYPSESGFVISVFTVFTYIIEHICNQRTVSVCIIYLYSVFILCVFFSTSPSFFFLLLYFLRIFPMSPCMHLSLAICLEDSIFGGPYVFEGTCLFMKAPSLLLPPSSFFPFSEA